MAVTQAIGVTLAASCENPLIAASLMNWQVLSPKAGDLCAPAVRLLEDASNEVRLVPMDFGSGFSRVDRGDAAATFNTLMLACYRPYVTAFGETVGGNAQRPGF